MTLSTLIGMAELRDSHECSRVIITAAHHTFITSSLASPDFFVTDAVASISPAQRPLVCCLYHRRCSATKTCLSWILILQGQMSINGSSHAQLSCHVVLIVAPTSPCSRGRLMEFCIRSSLVGTAGSVSVP